MLGHWKAEIIPLISMESTGGRKCKSRALGNCRRAKGTVGSRQYVGSSCHSRVSAVWKEGLWLLEPGSLKEPSEWGPGPQTEGYQLPAADFSEGAPWGGFWGYGNDWKLDLLLLKTRPLLCCRVIAGVTVTKSAGRSISLVHPKLPVSLQGFLLVGWHREQDGKGEGFIESHPNITKHSIKKEGL